MARDPKQMPRWWDQTDQGYELRFTHGTPGILDLIDLHVSALEGDAQAVLWRPADQLRQLRHELENAYRRQDLPLSKYVRGPCPAEDNR